MEAAEAWRRAACIAPGQTGSSLPGKGLNTATGAAGEGCNEKQPSLLLVMSARLMLQNAVHWQYINIGYCYATPEGRNSIHPYIHRNQATSAFSSRSRTSFRSLNDRNSGAGVRSYA